MSAKDPANRLRNPYELSGDEDRDLRQLNGRPSWAVVRLFATGGIGACAVAATVLGAGSAHAAPGDGFGGGGFGGGGDFGLGSGGLIDIPQASSTPSFDAFTTGPVSWAPTVSDTSTLFSDPTVLAGTSPASTVSTVPVDVAPVVVAPFDTTSAANGSGTTPPADTSATLWADPTVLATPPAATTSTAPAAENVPTPASGSGDDVAQATGTTADLQGFANNDSLASFGDGVAPSSTSSAAQPGDSTAVTWSDVQVPLNAPIGVSDPAFLPVDPAGTVAPGGADAGAGSVVTLSADQEPIAGADARSSTPVEGTGGAEQPAAVPVQVSTGWDDLTAPVDETFVVGERVDPPDAPVVRNGVSSDVPLTSAEPGVDGAPTAPDTLADLLATTPGGAPSAGVPGMDVPDSDALFLDGGDDVVPPTISPSAVADDAGPSAESPIMWSDEKVAVAGWSDRQGWGTSFDVGGEGAGQSPAVDGEVPVLSPSSPILWSVESAPVTGMPDLEGSETTFAGADAAVPVQAVQESSPSPGWMISTVRIGPDDELADVTLGGPEQGAMVASLYTEEGRRQVQSLLSNERVVASRNELDGFIADSAGKTRGLAINSTPLTQEQANLFYPVPAPEHPSLANLPAAMKPTFQEHYDKINGQDAEQAMASPSGFASPELACWIVCHRDGTSRVVPELYVGGSFYVDAGEPPVGELDLSDVTDLVLLHTHPLLVGADQSYDTTGLSAGDIGVLDAARSKLPPHVDPAVASVSVLEGTVTIARRDPVPGGTSSSVEDPEGGVRGPLRVRILPSSPGSPVSSSVQIQVDDPGTLEYWADAMEAPGVSEERYDAAQRAARGDLDQTALTDPPDLYARAVVSPEVWAAEGRRSRGLVVPPPVSSIDLPLPAGAADQSVDPEVGGSNAPSSTVPAPPDRETVPAGEGNAVTRPDATGTAPGGSSAGVVVRPEPGLTPEEQAGLGLIDLPGGWANKPPVELPDLTIPGGRPVDPDELDPNWAQRQEPFVVPESWGSPETFPNLPELENDIWTFPLPPEESPADAERSRVEPTPSPQGVVSSPEATFASPALQVGVPFGAGDVGWSSVAVQDPVAVQPASTVTQPSGGVMWSSRRATGGYTPPAAAAAAAPAPAPARATTGWSSQRVSRTYPLPARSTAAPVTAGFSPTLRAVAPADWVPGVSWAAAPGSVSAAVVRKPTAAAPAVTPVVRAPVVRAPVVRAPVVGAPVVRAVSTPAARSVTKPVRALRLVTGAGAASAAVDPVRQFTDFVGGAGKVLGENVVAPVGGVVESLVGGPVTVVPVDGDPLTHVGTTRYRASFLGGGTAVYDRESGKKLSGAGPAVLPSWQMPVPPAAVLVPLGVAAQELVKGVGGLLQPQMP